MNIRQFKKYSPNLFSSNIRYFLLAQIPYYVGYAFWSLLFNLYLKELQFSHDIIAGINMAATLSLAIFALPMAFIAAGHRIHKVIMFAQLVSFICFSLTCFYEDQIILYVLTSFAFLFSLAFRILSNPFIVANTTKLERTYAFGLLAVINYGGGVLGNLLSGPAVSFLEYHTHLDLITSYRIVMLSGLTLAFWGSFYHLLIKEDKRVKTEKSFEWKKIKTFQWKFFSKVLLVTTLIAVGAGFVFQYLNLYLSDSFKVNDAFIGTILSLQSAGMLLGVFLAPLVAERFGNEKTILYLYLLALPFMLALAEIKTLYLACVFVIMRSAFMNMAGPIMSTFANETLSKEEAPFFNALQITLTNLAWTLSSFIYGMIFLGDYRLSFYLASLSYALAIFFFWIFFVYRRSSSSMGP